MRIPIPAIQSKSWGIICSPRNQSNSIQITLATKNNNTQKNQQLAGWATNSRMDIPRLDKLNVSDEEPPNFEAPIILSATESSTDQLVVNEEEALKKANELKMEGNALFGSYQYKEAAGFPLDLFVLFSVK